MKKKLLYVIVGASLSSLPTFASTDIKQLAPNQYDCTVDELELYIMKRTENLRKESSVATWEDFKKTAQAAKLSGTKPSSTPANGSSAATVSTSLNKTGGTTAKKEDDCPLFFEDLEDVDMSQMEFPDLGALFSGGLSSLQDLANKQMNQLADSLTKVLKEGVCERLSTDYLTKLGTGVVDGALKEEIGYTTKDISKGNFANKVVNDTLKEQTGRSDAKLLNVMDEDLNKNRERYMDRQLDKKLDSVESDALDNL